MTTPEDRPQPSEVRRIELGVQLGTTKYLDEVEVPADATDDDIELWLETHVANHVESWWKPLDSGEERPAPA